MKKALEELKDLMGDSFVLLLDVFMQDTRARLENIATCIEQEDLDSIRDIAHAIKGSSRNVGAMDLAELCEQCEAMTISNDIQAITGLYNQACKVFDNICSVMLSVRDAE